MRVFTPHSTLLVHPLRGREGQINGVLIARLDITPLKGMMLKAFQGRYRTREVLIGVESHGEFRYLYPPTLADEIKMGNLHPPSAPMLKATALADGPAWRRCARRSRTADPSSCSFRTSRCRE